MPGAAFKLASGKYFYKYYTRYAAESQVYLHAQLHVFRGFMKSHWLWKYIVLNLADSGCQEK